MESVRRLINKLHKAYQSASVFHNVRYPESRRATGDAHAERSGCNLAAALTVPNHLYAPWPLLANTNFPNQINVICPVQSLAQKHSASSVGQINGLNPPVSPEGGAARDRHERCGGIRWTRRCRLTSGAAADGEVVWSWRPDAGAKSRE